MDGEDFQLNPIIPEPEPLDAGPTGSMGSSSSLAKTHQGSQQSFSNITSLFQPLSSPPQAQGPYQPPASWVTGEKRGPGQGAVDPRIMSYMLGHIKHPPYQAQASTPLSSMGGRQNLQWPPDPLITYQQQQQTRANKPYLMEPLSGEERLSCHQNIPPMMQKQR